MPGEWLSRALLLDPAAIPGDSACWADARELGLARLPILLGWRRTGGALVAGTSEGVATLALWVATADLAESTSQWTDERWDAAFRAFWARTSPPLRDALAERLALPAEVWTLESWSAAVWGTFATPVDAPAMAVVGSSVSEDVIQSITSLGKLSGAAAFTVEPLDRDGTRIRCSLVAGVLDRTRSLPGEMDAQDVARARREGTAPLDLLAAVERLARRAGATAAWCRREWVRYEGSRGAIRAFPTGEGAWLQLTGADEGTLTGLRFRHGLPLDHESPPGAPPGAHLFLPDARALTPAIETLVREWLVGT